MRNETITTGSLDTPWNARSAGTATNGSSIVNGLYEQQMKQASAAQQGNVGFALQPDKPKVREIPDKLERLFDRSEDLSQKLAKLNNRLRPVMVSVPEAPNPGKGATYATEIGSALAQLDARLQLMIDAVDAMDAQLEL